MGFRVDPGISAGEQGDQPALLARRELPIRGPCEPQMISQTPPQTLKKIHFQMSSLDLLSEMPVVNRFGENCLTEN